MSEQAYSDEVRAQFEAWAEPRGYSLVRTSDSYMAKGAASAWRGWNGAVREFAASASQSSTAGAAKGGITKLDFTDYSAPATYSNGTGSAHIAPQAAADSFPDECVATGQTCNYGPNGPKGERQCRYCGAAADTGAVDAAGVDEDKLLQLISNWAEGNYGPELSAFEALTNYIGGLLAQQREAGRQEERARAASICDGLAGLYGMNVGYDNGYTTAAKRAASEIRDGAAVPPAKAEGLTSAAQDVLAERQRQVSTEGLTPAHDDEHGDGELAVAAACYALQGDAIDYVAPESWPWAHTWWKPAGARRNLVKAGALVIAEIERIDRLAQQAKGATK